MIVISLRLLPRSNTARGVVYALPLLFHSDPTSGALSLWGVGCFCCVARGTARSVRSLDSYIRSTSWHTRYEYSGESSSSHLAQIGQTQIGKTRYFSVQSTIPWLRESRTSRPVIGQKKFPLSVIPDIMTCSTRFDVPLSARPAFRKTPTHLPIESRPIRCPQ